MSILYPLIMKPALRFYDQFVNISTLLTRVLTQMHCDNECKNALREAKLRRAFDELVSFKDEFESWKRQTGPLRAEAARSHTAP